MDKQFQYINRLLHTLPHKRKVIGLLIGVFFAFLFYSFLYVMREGIRIIFFLTEEYEVWVLTDAQVNFYNFVMAATAVIIGQSICFAYCFDTSWGRYGRQMYKMRSIVNDQRYLNSYFLNWASRIVFVFCIMLSMDSSGIHILNSHPEFNYIAILILLVLFFQSWTSIRRYFQHSFQWMALSFILLSFLSFGLSRIQLIDYKRINEIIYSHNSWHQYTIELPESEVYIYQKTGRFEAFLMIAEEKDSGKPILLIRRWLGEKYSPIELDSLAKTITKWKEEVYYESIDYSMLYIHKNTRMELVNQVKKKLKKAGAIRTLYGVLPSQREYDKSYYKMSVISYILNDLFDNPPLWQEEQSRLGINNIIRVVQGTSEEVSVDGVPIPITRLKEVIRLQLDNPEKAIELQTDNRASYDNYIAILQQVLQAFQNRREDASLIRYGTSFDDLEYEEQVELRKETPYRIVETIKQEETIH